MPVRTAGVASHALLMPAHNLAGGSRSVSLGSAAAQAYTQCSPFLLQLGHPMVCLKSVSTWVVCRSRAAWGP